MACQVLWADGLMDYMCTKFGGLRNLEVQNRCTLCTCWYTGLIAAACVQPSRHVARRTVHRRRRLCICMDIRAPITHTPTPSSSPFWPFILTSSHPHCLCACHATCPRLMIRFATSDSTSSSSLFYTWLYHKTELYLGPWFVCNFGPVRWEKFEGIWRNLWEDEQ